jgi:sodium-dependent phosphate cotransporter
VFNFLSVLILLPLELISHYSEIISGAIVRTVEYDSSVKEPELLTAITKPLTQKIVQLDKVVLDLLAQNKTKGGK